MWHQPFNYPAITLNLTPTLADRDAGQGHVAKGFAQGHALSNVITNDDDNTAKVSEFKARIAHTGADLARGRILLDTADSTSTGRRILAGGISIPIEPGKQRYLYKYDIAGMIAMRAYSPGLEIGVRFEGTDDDTERNEAERVVTAGMIPINWQPNTHGISAQVGFLQGNINASGLVHDITTAYAAGQGGSTHLAANARNHVRPTEICLLLVLRALHIGTSTSFTNSAGGNQAAGRAHAYGFADLQLQKIKDPDNNVIARRV